VIAFLCPALMVLGWIPTKISDWIRARCCCCKKE
jgi:hypothetical protein